MKIELSNERKILLVTVSISIFLISLGILFSNAGIFGNALILSIFIVAVPFLMMRYDRYRTLKEYEENFPTFLRDVTDSINSGMPFHQAISSASNNDYGRLSAEIMRMSNQISWGTPLDRVLNHFSDRVRRSKRLLTAMKTIRESYSSGGDILSTLTSVSDNLTLLSDAEKERSSVLNQYVVLMYALSFIFVGILVAINRLMIPIFQASISSGGEILGLSNPCAIGANAVCIIYELPAKYFFFLKDVTSIGAYYSSLFFYMSIIVSLTSGLVAGQISENSVTAGIKHSIIMTAVVIGALQILRQVNLLGV